MHPDVYRSKSRRADVYEPFRFFDELTRDFFTPTLLRRDGRCDLRTDIVDEGSCYVLEADLPGFKREDIHLDISGDTLRLCAVRENQREGEDKGGSYVRMERSFGSFCRQFDLNGVDTDKIKASYSDGVLKLTLPKKTESTPPVRSLPIE